MTNKKIELGDLVEDLVTGFSGVAIVRETHLFKCDRISVQPITDEDNKMPEHVYTFDAQSLKILEKGYVKKEETSESQEDPGNAMTIKKWES